jgi:UMF1 family MFS transporter
MCTIITAVFPVYFIRVAASTLEPTAALARFGLASTIAVTIVAVLSPILGAVADRAGIKKHLLAAFLGLGLLSTAAMALVGPGEWRLAILLFILANVGAFGSMTFYDALLPHIAGPDEIDRVSSAGYAIGYLGGGLLLLLNTIWILRPGWFGLADAAAASRLSFLSVAIWWALFSVPLFVRVPEPPRAGPDPRAEDGGVLRRWTATVRELQLYRQAFLMLVAFAIYNDGINTIIRMASSYGTEIGLGDSALIPAFILVQFVGVPFSFLFGLLADRLGVKPSIFLALAVYTGISVLGYFMTTALHFYVLAILVATVQGGSQALSRSLFASLIPRSRSAQFFGFFAIFEKFTGILGPAFFAAMVAGTGSSRLAVLSVVAFFIVGGFVLLFVRVEEGQAAARE